MFDEEKRVFLRNGYGCEIEGGVGVREGTWERGELKESVELYDGWYVKREESEVVKDVHNEVKVEDLRVEIHNWNEWENVNKSVTQLVIPSTCYYDVEWSVFDVSELKWLKSIEIGDDCFMYVEEVKLIGLTELRRVVIGENSFTKRKKDEYFPKNPDRHFYLRNCERLTDLKIGCFSFCDYSVCEIDNLLSLEVIEIGDLNGMSYNFYHASLELKSVSQRMK